MLLEYYKAPKIFYQKDWTSERSTTPIIIFIKTQYKNYYTVRSKEIFAAEDLLYTTCLCLPFLSMTLLP